MNKQAMNSHSVDKEESYKAKMDPFALEQKIRQSKLYKDRSENIKNKSIELSLQ